MGRTDLSKWAAFTVVAAGACVALFLACRYALLLFLPFLLAFLLAVSTRRAVCKLAERTGCSQKLCAVSVTLGALLLIGLLLFLICNRLLIEVRNLLEFLAEDSADPQGYVARLIVFFQGFSARLPFLSSLGELGFLGDWAGDPKAYLLGELQKALEALVEALSRGLASLLRRLPQLLFFLLVTFISCLFCAMDYERVKDVLCRLLPKRFAARLPELGGRALLIAKRCVKAYVLLFLLTFAELSVGFLCLGVTSPFLLAFLVASLDILPVLGVGTALVPWALFSFVIGEAGRGIALLVLFGIITVVRQVLEPHLLGKSIGVPPLLMLVAFYAGLRLFGVVGVIVGPILALAGKGWYTSRCAEKEKNAHS